MFGWLWMWTKYSMSLSSPYRKWNHYQPYYPSHYRVLYEALSRHNNLHPNRYDHHLTDEYLSPLVVRDQALALEAFAVVARPRRHRQSLSPMTRRRQLGLLWSKMSEAHKQSQRERNKNHFSMIDFKNILIHSANSIFMLHTIWICWVIAQHVRQRWKLEEICFQGEALEWEENLGRSSFFILCVMIHDSETAPHVHELLWSTLNQITHQILGLGNDVVDDDDALHYYSKVLDSTRWSSFFLAPSSVCIFVSA